MSKWFEYIALICERGVFEVKQGVKLELKATDGKSESTERQRNTLLVLVQQTDPLNCNTP